MEIEFGDRGEFRDWLMENASTHDGIWVRIFRAGSRESVSAGGLLEECLCFGWIDGRIRSEGESSYLKYCAPRTRNSRWSPRNREAVERLRREGLMTERGERVVAEAVADGRWTAGGEHPDYAGMISGIEKQLEFDSEALLAFRDCSLSEKKRYASFFYDARKEETRRGRLERIAAALRGERKGMLY